MRSYLSRAARDTTLEITPSGDSHVRGLRPALTSLSSEATETHTGCAREDLGDGQGTGPLGPDFKFVDLFLGLSCLRGCKIW